MEIPFHLHFDVLAVAAGLLVLYELGIRRLADAYCPDDEDPVTGVQRGLFYAGVITLVVVAAWPVHDIAQGRLFLFHMIEHTALALIVPPLLLAGTPWWLMRVLVAPIMHAFWKEKDELVAQMQMAQFMKNMSMVGGAIIIFWIYNQLQGEAPLSLTDPLLGRW